MMHGPGKSDSAIVAVKPTNKAGRPAAEPVERMAEAECMAGDVGISKAYLILNQTLHPETKCITDYITIHSTIISCYVLPLFVAARALLPPMPINWWPKCTTPFH